jgi:hypothetical protein
MTGRDDLTGYALDMHRMTSRETRRRAVGMFAILQATQQGGGQWTREHIHDWARIYARELGEKLTGQGFAAWFKQAQQKTYIIERRGWCPHDVAWYMLGTRGAALLDLLGGMGGAVAAMAAREDDA